MMDVFLLVLWAVKGLSLLIRKERLCLCGFEKKMFLVRRLLGGSL